MKHSIPVEQLKGEIGPQVEAMARAVEACVHCGFCLPACPTYQVLGEEMDSPRGRILLMKSVLERELSLEDAVPYIDRCLGCLGCVTACPSGVRYDELVTPFKGYAEKNRSYGLARQAQRSLLKETLPYAGRFRLAAGAGRLARPFRELLPKELHGMLDMLPGRLPRLEPLPSEYPANGRRRARVALLAGCVQQALAPGIDWATLRVLAYNGVEVMIPADQGCCGGILVHTGQQEAARELARRNLKTFSGDVDVVLTNAAGCGSAMKEYGLLFKGQKEQDTAEAFAGRVMDVSEFLDQLGLLEPHPLPGPLKLAYHDACHLAHAQGISAAPRRLLQAIPNLSLLEIAQGELCCGSAGTYNLEQPDIAETLGQRKAENILNSGCEAVAAGNIGCIIQIRTYLQKLARPLTVYHTMEVLDMAYQEAGPAS